MCILITKIVEKDLIHEGPKMPMGEHVYLVCILEVLGMYGNKQLPVSCYSERNHTFADFVNITHVHLSLYVWTKYISASCFIVQTPVYSS